MLSKLTSQKPNLDKSAPGEGGATAPGEGPHDEMSRLARPHPALRATFSRWEKDSTAAFGFASRFAYICASKTPQ